MLREPSMTPDRCHGPTPGCHFPPPVTDHSKRLPPGFNKTWGIRKEGSVERERGLEFLCEIATVVRNIDSDQIHQYGQASPSVLINISMLANASLMLHLQWPRVFPPFGYGKCCICNASSWVVVSVFSVSSRSTVSHSRCAYLSSDRAEKPGKAPEIFAESDIKISGTQNIERSAEGARHIFMPNHSQVRRAARKDHAELCALCPLASCQAAFFPQEYQSELL